MELVAGEVEGFGEIPKSLCKLGRATAHAWIHGLGGIDVLDLRSGEREKLLGGGIEQTLGINAVHQLDIPRHRPPSISRRRAYQ